MGLPHPSAVAVVSTGVAGSLRVTEKWGYPTPSAAAVVSAGVTGSLRKGVTPLRLLLLLSVQVSLGH